MALAVTAEEMLAYTGEEREKWHDWFAAHPQAALDAAWQMMEHIFVVERRHFERLTSAPRLSTSTGVEPPGLEALFHFARTTRADLRAYILCLSPEDAGRQREFTVAGGTFQLTPRKLIFHIFLHEIRHWAQIAAAVRAAGFAPPGSHDLFYSAALA